MFAIGLILAAVLFHRLFGMGTPVALNIFKLAFALAGLAIVTGVVALVGVWRRGLPGGANALLGVGCGVLILCWPLSLVPKLRALPPINDVSTDTTNPPQFRVLAEQRKGGANPPAYPGASFAEQQKRFYRELQPLILNRSAQDAFDLVGQSLRRLRMVPVGEVPPGGENGAAGLIEAYDRTLVLGFYDDVAVRITPFGRGVRIDVRSASRYGRHDFGRNAQRVRELLNEIVARADATVPDQGGRRSARPTPSRNAERAVRRPVARRRE